MGDAIWNEAFRPKENTPADRGRVEAGVRQRQDEWQRPNEGTRDLAQQRFLEALQIFAAFVIDSKLSEDYK